MASATEGLVFLLWGAFAKKKRHLLCEQRGRHHILEAAHPSPLARGCCGHFGRAGAL